MLVSALCGQVTWSINKTVILQNHWLVYLCLKEQLVHINKYLIAKALQ